MMNLILHLEIETDFSACFLPRVDEERAWIDNEWHVVRKISSGASALSLRVVCPRLIRTVHEVTENDMPYIRQIPCTASTLSEEIREQAQP